MKTSYKVAAVLTSLAFISTPLIVSAQSDTGVDSQIESLASQIQALESQLKTLVQSVVSSTTFPTWQISSTSLGVAPANPGSPLPRTGGGKSVPCPTISRNLSVGSSGSDVMGLQQMLSGMGFLNASSTGFFGQLTANALGEFQTQFGISSSTGFLGPITRQFLNARCAGGAGTSTPPWVPGNVILPNGVPTNNNGGAWGNGSSTPNFHPCAQNGATTSIEDQAAAVVAALFVPHTIIPGLMNGGPCHGVPGVPPQQDNGSGGSGSQ